MNTKVMPPGTGDGGMVVADKPRRSSTWKSIDRIFSSFKPGSTSDEEQRLSQAPPPYSDIHQTETSASSKGLLTPTETLPLDEKAKPLSDPAKHPEDAKLLDQATAFLPPSANLPDNLPPLPKPVLVPRLNPGATFPFTRAWAPELDNHAITQREWLAFLDNLNIISSPHPSITLFQVAAIGIAFVPLDGADGIAVLVEVVAALLVESLARARCKRFLEKVNSDYFHPRGLHAHIIDSKRVKRALGLEPKDPLVAPLSETTVDMTAQQRCMEHLKDHTCELTWEVPEPSPQTERLAKLAAWNVKHHIREVNKKTKCQRKRAWKKLLKGKKLKREGREEKTRAKKITWVLLQNLQEFEEQEKVIAEELAAKKAAKKAKKEKGKGKGQQEVQVLVPAQNAPATPEDEATKTAK